MNTLQKLGVILILAGIALPLFGFNVPSPLATVVWEYSYLSLATNPYGTEQFPHSLVPGSTVNFVGELYVSRWVGSVGPSVSRITATAPNLNVVVNLTPRYMGEDYNERDELTAYRWNLEGSWSVPASLPLGTLVRFDWYAEVKGFGVSATTYGKAVGADGYFEVGTDKDPYQRASETSIILVTSGNLKFRFTATNNGALIDRVYVYVETTKAKVDLTETQADTVWTGSYTLPGKGSYVIKGYFCIVDATFQRMNVLIPIDGSETSQATTMKYLNWLTIPGAILLLIGSVRRRER